MRTNSDSAQNGGKALGLLNNRNQGGSGHFEEAMVNYLLKHVGYRFLERALVHAELVNALAVVSRTRESDIS